MVLRRVAGLLLATMLVAASAAGQARSATTTVRIAIPGNEANLTPYTMTFFSGVGLQLVELIYDTLFWSSATGDKPAPLLADRYEASADNLTWTVHLHPGVTWHDGTPLTAEDVKFTYEYHARFPVAGRFSHHAYAVGGVEVVDELTAVFKLKEPSPEFLRFPLADLPILPKHIWNGVVDPAKFTGPLAIGSGPYKLVEYQPDRLYRLVANESYFQGKPAVGELVVPIIKDASAALLALRSAEVDAVGSLVTPDLIPDLERAGAKVARGTDFTTVVLQYDVQRYPFGEPSVRRALALAVDRQKLLDTLVLGYGKVGNPGYTHPDVPWANNDLKLEFDPAKARALLDAAGFVDRGTGVRQTPRGTPMKFNVLARSTEPESVRGAELVSLMLKDIGVQIDVQVLDSATFRARTASGWNDKGRFGDFDLAIQRHGVHFHSDPDAMFYLFHSDTSQGKDSSRGVLNWQGYGYANPEFDRLADQQATIADAGKRTTTLRRMQAIIADDLPLVTLYHPESLYAYRDAAYTGWRYLKGEGLIHRGSFVGLPAGTTDPSAATAGPPVLAGVVATLLGVAVGMIILRRMRRRGPA